MRLQQKRPSATPHSSASQPTTLLVSECKALWGERSSIRDLQHEDVDGRLVTKDCLIKQIMQLYHFVWEV